MADRTVWVSVEFTEGVVRIQGNGADPLDVTVEEAHQIAQEVGIAAESLRRFEIERLDD